MKLIINTAIHLPILSVCLAAILFSWRVAAESAVPQELGVYPPEDRNRP